LFKHHSPQVIKKSKKNKSNLLLNKRK